MKLSEILKRYRAEHKLSQREFARLCGGVTNGYISMVENETNPCTGKKVFPSVEKLSSFARGMGISLKELMEAADDIDVQGSDSSAPASINPTLIPTTTASSTGQAALDGFLRFKLSLEANPEAARAFRAKVAEVKKRYGASGVSA